MYFKETLKFICDFHPSVKKIEKYQVFRENTNNKIRFLRISDYKILVSCGPKFASSSSGRRKSQ